MALQTIGAIAVLKGYRDFTNKMNKMGDSMQDAGKKATGAGGMFQRAGGAFLKFGTMAAGAAIAGIAAVGGALTKMAIDAAPLEGIGAAFEGITDDIGVGSDQMLKSLQEASLGMVTNRELMKSFNQAAALVSKDFAQELPGAMKFLGKVSAATGKDMGFMMDSLVRGVGRLSPMILDNLDIQVDLTKAYEDWAVAQGIAVEEMTKTQQQAAVMAQVMAKLEENTAALPEVAGTASQQMAAFKTSIANTKDEIGIALLPLLKELLAGLQNFAANVLPQVVAWVSGSLVPALGRLASWIREKVIPAIRMIVEWLQTNLPPAISAATEFFNTKLLPVFNKIVGAIKTVIKWFKDLIATVKNIKLPDWLSRKSPSPFEMTFIGAGEAIKKLATRELPRLSASLQMAQAPALAPVSQRTNIDNRAINVGSFQSANPMDDHAFDQRMRTWLGD